MSRVVHFEISADQPERAAKFYEEVFGWKFQKWEGGGEPYWLITTGEAPEPGIDGGMAKRTKPEEGTVNTVGVTSVEEAIGMITRAGGTVVRPRHAIPGVGYQAYCLDPEGNLFGIHERNESAR